MDETNKFLLMLGLQFFHLGIEPHDEFVSGRDRQGNAFVGINDPVKCLQFRYYPHDRTYRINTHNVLGNLRSIMRVPQLFQPYETPAVRLSSHRPLPFASGADYISQFGTARAQAVAAANATELEAMRQAAILEDIKNLQAITVQEATRIEKVARGASMSNSNSESPARSNPQNSSNSFRRPNDRTGRQPQQSPNPVTDQFRSPSPSLFQSSSSSISPSYPSGEGSDDNRSDRSVSSTCSSMSTSSARSKAPTFSTANDPSKTEERVKMLRKCIRSYNLFANDNEGMSQLEIIAVPNPDKNPVANYADLYTFVTNRLEGLCRQYGIPVQRNDIQFVLSYNSVRDELINRFFSVDDRNEAAQPGPRR